MGGHRAAGRAGRLHDQPQLLLRKGGHTPLFRDARVGVDLDPVGPLADLVAHHAPQRLAVGLLRALRHPHLVTLYGVGKSGPYVWIAQEHVDGESIAEALERIAAGSKPKWPHAVRLGIHVAKALHAITLLIAWQLMHELEVVARDIDVHLVPTLCPLAVSPFDFSAAPQLMERAAAEAQKWIVEGGLTRRARPQELAPHRH